MIFLLGGTGYVGQYYQNYFRQRGISCRVFRRQDLDYADVSALTRLLREEKPDFLINAAGYTGKPNVDACETDKTNCLFGNAILPGRISEACGEAGIPWGHVSSGCIYTGRRADGEGFTESDPPNFTFRQNNCSFYSGTKALGEEILADNPQCYIWRLRIPFDNRDNPRNYLTKLMRYATLLEAENSISQLEEFVAGTFACFEKKIPFGTYNVTNPGHVSTRQVTDLILAEGRRREEEGQPNPFPSSFAFFSSEADFMAKAAKTPRSNCVMSSTKLADAGISLTPVTEAITKALRTWESA